MSKVRTQLDPQPSTKSWVGVLPVVQIDPWIRSRQAHQAESSEDVIRVVLMVRRSCQPPLNSLPSLEPNTSGRAES